MNDQTQSDELRLKRAQAVRTAWILGIIAASIFTAFIGSAIIGR